VALSYILVDLCVKTVKSTRHVRASLGDFALYFPDWILCMRLCCALDKLCAVCIYVAIKYAATHMPSVTVILFKGLFQTL